LRSDLRGEAKWLWVLGAGDSSMKLGLIENGSEPAVPFQAFFTVKQHYKLPNESGVFL
jgi:hypothetical protein